jgi:predicted transcriptional regulator
MLEKVKRYPQTHIPTIESRAQVKALSSFGIRITDIAQYIGINQRTLTKHYAEELASGRVQANAKVAQSLFRNAVEENNVAAQIFWLKSRAGWSEKVRVQDVTSPPVELARIDYSKLSKQALEEIAAASIPVDDEQHDDQPEEDEPEEDDPGV